MTNPIAGLTGIEYLQQGHNANKSLNHLVKEDIDCERRQLIIMDNYGDTADWTGQYCLPWCGSLSEPNLAIAGNMLASEQVLMLFIEAIIKMLIKIWLIDYLLPCKLVPMKVVIIEAFARCIKSME